MSRFIESFIEYQDYQNSILNLNPLTKLNILMGLGISAMFVPYWQYGFALCIFFGIIAFIAGKGKNFLKIFSVLFLVLGVLTMVIRQFSVSGNTVMFTLFGVISVTKEGWYNGLEISSSLLGFSGAIVLFFQITQIKDLMLAFEKKGMSHEVSYIVLASFQTITDLRSNLQTIMESQRARGIETEGNLILRMKSFFPVIGPLVLSAISNTEEKVISMDARAFSSKNQHTFLRELRPMPKLEIILLIAFNILFILILGLRLLGKL